MGRGKIEIKYIEKKETRQVTFSKRKNGLIKKAQELAIMCHAEVALIIFSNTGRLHQYSGHSTSVRHVIHRYLQHPQAQLRYDQIFHTTYDAGECKTFDLRRFYGQLRELIGGKLESLNADELQILEDELEVACSKVRKKKDEVVMETFQSLRKELEDSVKINRQYEKCLIGQSNTITMLGDDAVQTAQSLECHPMYSLEDKSGGMSAEIPNPPLPVFPSHTPHSYPELKLG